jgi:hypothetical protein
MLIRMLVLANSFKNRGRCLAGLNVETGKWVRPVPNTLSRSIDNELTIFSERFIRPGDLIDVEIGRAIPLPYHPEDVELTGTIKIVGKNVTHYLSDLIAAELRVPNQLLETPTDRISIEQVRASQVRNSLALSSASEINFFENERGSHRVRFLANNHSWSLANTDDNLENKESLQEALVCISLAEPFEITSSHHKLAAGFISLDRSYPEFNSFRNKKLFNASDHSTPTQLNAFEAAIPPQDPEPRVGRKVHTQKHGIGVIKMVGEFYLEIDFKKLGVRLLSRDDLDLDYLD